MVIKLWSDWSVRLFVISVLDLELFSEIKVHVNLFNLGITFAERSVSALRYCFFTALLLDDLVVICIEVPNECAFKPHKLFHNWLGWWLRLLLGILSVSSGHDFTLRDAFINHVLGVLKVNLIGIEYYVLDGL